MMRKSAYAQAPWTEEAKKRKKQIRRQQILDHVILGLFFFMAGAFAAVLTLSYYPLPW